MPIKILFALVFIVVIFVLAILSKFQSQDTVVIPNIPPASSTPNIELNEQININASFTIVTNGISRNFSSKMYHNLSEEVYIEASNPSIVHVKTKGTTWDDFFKTLPMKLTKECLTTGTKETFCTGENGTLKFYLNNIEDKNLLDKEINEGDKTRIVF